MITGIKDIYYNVSNMRISINFYKNVLGMKVISNDDYWAAMEIDGVTVGLHWSEGQEIPEVPYDSHGAHCGATLTLSTNDFEKDTNLLMENEVEIVGRLDECWGKLTVFKDPDGNILKLMQID